MAFGGKPLHGHSIPEVYGAIEPTAVFVPIEQLIKDEHFGAATTEVFGPLQARYLLGSSVPLMRLGVQCDWQGPFGTQGFGVDVQV